MGSRPHSVPKRCDFCTAQSRKYGLAESGSSFRADFFWTLIATQRDRAVEEVAARLMEETSKTRENGEA